MTQKDKGIEENIGIIKLVKQTSSEKKSKNTDSDSNTESTLRQ